MVREESLVHFRNSNFVSVKSFYRHYIMYITYFVLYKYLFYIMYMDLYTHTQTNFNILLGNEVSHGSRNLLF